MENDSNTCNGDNVVIVDVVGDDDGQEPFDMHDHWDSYHENNAKDTLNREGVEQRVVIVRLLLKFSARSANC